MTLQSSVIPGPVLDDRDWQQLRDDLVRRIPVYTPEWTDHNASDPGITLIELFAHLAEGVLFRFNQIPEATRLAWLNLLQIPPRPATPAKAMVALSTAQSAGVLVPLGAELAAGKLPFESETEVTAWPLSVRALAKARAATPDPDTEPEAHAFALRAIDSLGDGPVNPAYYEARTLDPEGAGEPVDFTTTVDGTLWIAVLGERGADLARLADATLNIGFVPTAEVPALADVSACPGVGAGGPRYAVEWRISTGTFDGDEPRYRTLAVVGDTTAGLTREGVVRLRLPPAGVAVGDFPVDDPDRLGTGALPPVLAAPDQARLLFWLRAFRVDGTGIGAVSWVGVNAVQALQARTARPELVGTGSGQPGQRLRLAQRPVLVDSLALEVEEADGWQPWQTVDGFHASGPLDRHYVLDPVAGEVVFGDGIRGAPPPLGARVRAVRYRVVGGAAGNVAAGAIDKVVAIGGVKAKNALPAYGGGDAESLAAALGRIPLELRVRDRAVTAEDFRALARAVPGVARAECLPRVDPAHLGVEAAGVVSVVVWPANDPAHPNAPLPDRRLLRAVCEYLDARRLVTTELYVIPPVYRPVAVSVGLQAKPGYGIDAVRRWVETVIRQYLAPLPPYGPGGEGWPLGRRVHGPELEAAALQVEGVEYLEGLEVAERVTATDGSVSWVPGTVVLAAHEVVELVTISVTQGAPAAVGADLPPPPTTDEQGQPAAPVPVPVLRDEC